MTTATKHFGIKMPTKARFRKCPVCKKPGVKHSFRESNRTPAQNIICWECRHDAQVEKDFYGKKPLSFKSRKQSAFRRRFFAVCKELRRKNKKKEVNEMSVKHDAAQLMKFPERIAAIVGKTYSIRGDDWKMSNDEALTRIRDLLDEIDPTLIKRNQNKRLSR